MRMNRKKGFSLIELIAVIAIIGILTGILVPNILENTNKSKIAKVKADAQQVLNTINIAKAQSNTPDSIEDYTDAISVDSSLILPKLPTGTTAAITTLNVTQLQAIISSSSKTYSTLSEGVDGPTVAEPAYASYYIQ